MYFLFYQFLISFLKQPSRPANKRHHVVPEHLGLLDSSKMATLRILFSISFSKYQLKINVQRR